MKTDCYILLEIAPDADEKTIRKAWRTKSKLLHPDINNSPDATNQFRELSEAMELLLNPGSRIKHDRHFGYSEKPKDKKDHAKQTFSDFQNSKAEKNVNEWSNDYNVAMAMREEQKKKHLAKHQRNIRILRIAFGGIAIILLSVVIYVISRKA